MTWEYPPLPEGAEHLTDADRAIWPRFHRPFRSQQDFQVLLLLLRNQIVEGLTWMDIEVLIDDDNVRRTTIDIALRDFVQAGLVEVVAQTSDRRTRYRANRPAIAQIFVDVMASLGELELAVHQGAMQRIAENLKL